MPRVLLTRKGSGPIRLDDHTYDLVRIVELLPEHGAMWGLRVCGHYIPLSSEELCAEAIPIASLCLSDTFLEVRGVRPDTKVQVAAEMTYSTQRQTLLNQPQRFMGFIANMGTAQFRP
uniref:Uncharacterized protein n=1 Tax=viral metagenome TaxID=1070528 RepID=A0A6C0BQF1_9ZZZZ